MNCTSIAVRGYHCDSYGHVNNARYLEFLEEARWNWLEPAIEHGTIDFNSLSFIVVNINVSYKKPMVPGDVAKVCVDEIDFNNMSVMINQNIYREGKPCVQAIVTFVMLDKQTGRPVPINDKLQNIFRELSHTSE